MTLLSVRGASKAFGGTRAIFDVSLDVERGYVHGLIGPNGAGKTTLLNVISGFVQPDQGQIQLEGRDITRLRVDRRARLGIVRTFQDGRMLDDLTVNENVWLGSLLGNSMPLSEGPRDSQSSDDALTLLGLQDDRNSLVGELPAGKRKAVEIGRALVAAPRLMLLDEPFSGLTPTETDQVIELIRTVAAAGSCGIVLVEHNLGAVFDVCEVVTAMDGGTVLLTAEAGAVRTSPQVEEAFFGPRHERDPDDAARFSPTTATVRAMPRSSPDAQAARLSVNGATAGYGRLTIVHDVNMTVASGEIVGLVGVNGAGKSTLLSALAGLLPIRSGKVLVDGLDVTTDLYRATVKTGISLASQDRNLFRSLTAAENLRVAAKSAGLGRRDAAVRVDEIFDLLPALSPFRDRRANLLSGGQKQLLAIARALISRPRVLLLDEPATGLAVGMLARLGDNLRQLADSGMALVVAEQNVRFAQDVCTRALIIQHGVIVAEGDTDELEDAWKVVVA